MTENAAPARVLGVRTSIALVFGASAAVLVLELVSLRLVAPYLGLTLETNTAIIGVALAAIATGSALGGRFADLVPPTRSLGPLLLVSGALVLLVLPAVRWTGELVRGGGNGVVFLVVALVMFVPAALLAAVTPMVTKLQLGTLAQTGTVVGRLSAYGTAGAIAGTVLTGFVFVAKVRTSAIVLVLGGVLVITGVVLTIVLRGRRAVAAPLALALVGTGATVLAPRLCEVETAYHCARVVADPLRPAGRTLYLDTSRSSYVDLDDPLHLDFEYTRGIVAAVEARWPGDEGLRALHIGGGGLTIPRYLSTLRPDTANLVYEIDPGVVDVDVDHLGAKLGGGMDVRVGDARTGVRDAATDSQDLVVGDAFGGVGVPWHLTTREIVEDIRRVLVDDGMYVVNVIDYAPLDFARAEVRTIGAVFPHVAVLARPASLSGTGGGNVLIVGSEQPLPLDRIRTNQDQRRNGYGVLGTPAEIAGFVGDAILLTDDFAPVEQLLTRPR